MPRLGGFLDRRSDSFRPEHAFLPLLKVTAWIAGLLISFVLGMLSTYLVLSGAYFGSRFVARLRHRAIDAVIRGD
jgi:hypothetical protein